MYITFVVKDCNPEIGTDARLAMLTHGIKAERINYTRDAVVFKTPNADQLDSIARWFAEAPELTPGFGYPNGTCLVYSFHED